MKRKEIIAELNRLTLHYNLTWDDVKGDADKAIHEINFLMGTAYPEMSHVLLTDSSEYVIRSDDGDIEIIKPIYIRTVVVPYIAMEVLARDEEFTTIYSKYQMEYQNNKFIMFSNEFNNVPVRFKRNVPAGVFFPANNKGKDIR